MLHVAIVDDDEKIADLMKSFLKQYTDERKTVFSVECYSDPADFLSVYGNGDCYDMIFLDIELPGMNGMDVARKIRDIDIDVALVFVTNMRQYAIKGYEVDADDFIVKPVSYYDFAMKLDRVLRKIEKKETVKIAVNCDGVVKYLPIDTIRYVEVARHRLTYHTDEGILETRGSLNKIEELFLENNFSRCNNYCLVNLRYVTGIDGHTLFVGYGRNNQESDPISISYPRKKEFVASLNKYLGVIL